MKNKNVKMKTRLFKTLFLIILASAFFLLSLFVLPNPANDFEIENLSKTKDIVEAPRPHEPGDIENQKPLASPPAEIKAIYLTSSSAGNPKKIDELIGLIKKSEVNAVVIDIKDYTGRVFYDSGIEEVEKYQAEKIVMPKINALIKKLHNNNIYVIARQVVFQDSVLAAARPDLAVRNRLSGKIWKDDRGLAWTDPSSEVVWDYNIKIARNASARGFDEINFDYIRFPSDGQLSATSFPFFDKKNISKAESIQEFFAYLRANLGGIKISADLFGLTTSAKDDLGIGQVIENGYENFDFVSPMVYPSHYAKSFLGFSEPAMHPYEVVKYAMASAVKKLKDFNEAEALRDPKSGTRNIAKIRPWIQAFNMGGIYDTAKIKAQIKASDEAGGVGWMLWNPGNNYYFLNNF